MLAGRACLAELADGWMDEWGQSGDPAMCDDVDDDVDVVAFPRFFISPGPTNAGYGGFFHGHTAGIGLCGKLVLLIKTSCMFCVCT